MCSMLKYGTGICCYAFMYLKNIFTPSVPFFNIFLKCGIDKLMEWSTIPACPSLKCFFNRVNTKGTDCWKMMCLMFVYVFCKFVSGLILWFLDNFLFGDLPAE